MSSQRCLECSWRGIFVWLRAKATPLAIHIPSQGKNRRKPAPVANTPCGMQSGHSSPPFRREKSPALLLQKQGKGVDVPLAVLAWTITACTHAMLQQMATVEPFPKPDIACGHAQPCATKSTCSYTTLWFAGHLHVLLGQPKGLNSPSAGK